MHATHWMNDPRARRVQSRISFIFILLGLAAAMGTRYAYQHAIQAPACYEYARRTRLPEREHLRFESARIATKQREHVCYFSHELRDAPVALRLERDDVPHFRDGAEIASILAAFMLVILLGKLVSRAWLRRNGFTLPGGSRPADPAP